MGKTKEVKDLELGADIWAQYVPILSTSEGKNKVYDIYLQDEIQSPALYNEACYIMNKAKKSDIIHLHINTPGGYLDTAFRLTDAIDRCKATTVAILTGTVASAGTLIALRCDKVQVPTSLQFMIHNYSGGVVGKGHEIIDHATFSKKELSTAFKTVYLGFLTKKEVKEVIAGKDVWMGSKKVLNRWKAMKKFQGDK